MTINKVQRPAMVAGASHMGNVGLIAFVILCCLLSAIYSVRAEDGRVIKQYNYLQTASGIAVPNTNAPYSFDASMSRFDEFSSGSLILPASSAL